MDELIEDFEDVALMQVCCLNCKLTNHIVPPKNSGLDNYQQKNLQQLQKEKNSKRFSFFIRKKFKEDETIANQESKELINEYKKNPYC